jgi:hypothetical protein
VKSRIPGLTATALATGLLAGCYVIPIDPRYPAAEQASMVIPGRPMPLTQGGPLTLQARLYPLNEIAGKSGPLSVTFSDNVSGHASFSLTYAGELLQGEATRVGPHYPGFGKVHREVYGDGRMPAGQRGIASAAGPRGLYVNCEYAIMASNRGAGACLFSNGATYQVHFGS